MANPRYYQPEERKSGMARKLERLGALTALDGPPQAKQVDAMRMLGLFQEMQNAKAQQEYHNSVLEEQRLNREGDDAYRQQALQEQVKARGVEDLFRNNEADRRSGEFWQGTLPQRYSEQTDVQQHQKRMQEIANAGQQDESGYRWNVLAPNVYADNEAKTNDAKARADAVAFERKLKVAEAYGGVDQRVSADILSGLPEAQPSVQKVGAGDIQDKASKLFQLWNMAQSDPKLAAGLPPITPEVLAELTKMRGAPTTQPQQGSAPQATTPAPSLPPPPITNDMSSIPDDMLQRLVPSASQPFSMTDYYTPPDHPDATATTGAIHPFDFIRDIFRTSVMNKPALGPNGRFQQYMQELQQREMLKP